MLTDILPRTGHNTSWCAACSWPKDTHCPADKRRIISSTASCKQFDWQNGKGILMLFLLATSCTLLASYTVFCFSLELWHLGVSAGVSGVSKRYVWGSFLPGKLLTWSMSWGSFMISFGHRTNWPPSWGVSEAFLKRYAPKRNFSQGNS